MPLGPVSLELKAIAVCAGVPSVSERWRGRERAAQVALRRLHGCQLHDEGWAAGELRLPGAAHQSSGAEPEYMCDAVDRTAVYAQRW